MTQAFQGEPPGSSPTSVAGDTFFDVRQGANKATVVKLEGVISGPQPGIPDNMLISADDVEKLVLAALEDAQQNGGRVVLDIKTPGGSAVESNLIGQAIRSLRKQYPDVPVDAHVTGMCASGGNMIVGMKGVVDNVYASPQSIMGSVGVVHEYVDPTGYIERLGGIVRKAISGAQKRDYTYADSAASLQKGLEKMHRDFKDMMIEKFGDRILSNPDAIREIAYDLKVKTGRADALGRRQIEMMRSQLSKKERGPQAIDFDGYEERLRASEDPKYSDAQIAHMLSKRLQNSPAPWIQEIGRQAVSMTDTFDVDVNEMPRIKAEAEEFARSLNLDAKTWSDLPLEDQLALEDVLFNGDTWTAEQARSLGIVDEIFDSATDMLFAKHGIRATETRVVSKADLGKEKTQKMPAPAGT